MKYFFRNITINNPPRTIILFVLGGCSWMVSLLGEASIKTLLPTLGLTLLNALLFAVVLYKAATTNHPTLFAWVSYWFAMSALPVLHNCWQAQVVVSCVLLSYLILTKITFQKEATEEAFLIALIGCFLPPIAWWVKGICLLLLWGYMLVKGYLTFRVWCASLVAVALYTTTMLILQYMGWTQWLGVENMPALTWQQWVLSIGLYVSTILFILMPLRKSSVTTGVCYTIYMLALIIAGTLMCLGVLE